MQGVFLVGGKGTRLGELTKSTPKPLLEVQGKPFIEWVITKAKNCGITSILLLAGYRAEDVKKLNYPVIIEHKPLGTGGALRNAKGYLREEFFLFNGDTICDFNYMELKEKLRDAECVSAIIKSSNNSWIGAGVYFMKRHFLERIPEGTSSLESVITKDDAFYKVSSNFIDIGTPEDYKKAQKEKWLTQI